MSGRAAALPASAPNWRQAKSNLERAPQVGVNLESTSASLSQPVVALKTWSQHLKTWSELAPNWSEPAPTGASSLQVGAKSERVERAKKSLVTWWALVWIGQPCISSVGGVVIERQEARRRGAWLPRLQTEASASQ